MKQLLTKLSQLLRAIRYQRNWIDQIRYLGGIFPPPVFEMKLRCGYMIEAEYADRVACNEVWLDRAYALPLPAKNFKNIIDVGGHVGSATIYFAHIAPQARIFAYEPSPRNFRFLEKNIRINSLQDRVYCYPLAVNGAAGEKTFYITDATGGNSFFEYEKGRPIKVKTTTLPLILSENHIEFCDLLKLDCEGAEWEILFSASENFFSRVGNIILEYHAFAAPKNYDNWDLRRLLEKNNFKVISPRKYLLFATKSPVAK